MVEEVKRSFVLKRVVERYVSMSKRSNKAGSSSKKAPTGCFSVYVGPSKERFVIKAECANHPLFKMLLEDAEMEYGFTSEGPLQLPCDVHLFCKILAEMDSSDRDHDDQFDDLHAYGSCTPFSPARRRFGKSPSYGLLTPPRLLKINHF